MAGPAARLQLPWQLCFWHTLQFLLCTFLGCLPFFVAFGGAWRLSVLAILDGWQLGFVCVAFFCSSMSACVSVVLLNIYAVVFGHIGHFLAFFGLFWLL